MGRDIYSIYEGTEPYLFISYSHQDNDQVIPVIHGLQKLGYRVWYDTGITVGGRWPDIIAEHVMKSSCVIAFLSQNAMASDYCQEEIFFALEEHRPIIPVYLEEVVLPPGLRMRLNIRQAIYRSRFVTDAAFLTKLTNETYLKPSFSGKINAEPSLLSTADVYHDEFPHIVETVRPLRTRRQRNNQVIEYTDELLPHAVDTIMESKIAAVSLIQRRLHTGYLRSAHLIDEIEKLGIISPYNGTTPRKILITPEQWDTMKTNMKLAE